jgi:hypothetical protein
MRKENTKASPKRLQQARLAQAVQQVQGDGSAITKGRMRMGYSPATAQ